MRHLIEATLMLVGIAAPAWGAPAQLKLGQDDVLPFTSVESEALRSFVARAAEGRRVIGLGESSHFTRECYELKEQMVLSLMDQGYDGLVLEVDFGQALLWNEFVVHGTGDLDRLIARSGWFTYRTEEFKSLLATIRAENVARAERGAAAPFQVFGMEMTTVQDSLSWLARYLEFEAVTPSEARARLVASLKKERTNVAFQEHTVDERMEYWELYHTAASFLTSNEAELVDASGVERFAVAIRIAETLRQYATYVSHDDFSLKVEIRDQFSSRNLLWCMNQLGDTSRVVLWAHNGHVAKEAPRANYNVLGHHLNRWFGEEYYAFGFTFNEGECAAFSNEGFKTFRFERSVNDSATTRLAAFESPFLVLDIARLIASGGEHAAFAQQPVAIRTDLGESFSDNSPRYMDIELGGTYDALIYTDKAHRATGIDWVR